MDTTKVHNSKQAFPVMVKYLANCGGDFPGDTEKAQLLHWYVSSSIWGPLFRPDGDHYQPRPGGAKVWQPYCRAPRKPASRSGRPKSRT